MTTIFLIRFVAIRTQPDRIIVTFSSIFVTRMCVVITTIKFILSASGLKNFDKVPPLVSCILRRVGRRLELVRVGLVPNPNLPVG